MIFWNYNFYCLLKDDAAVKFQRNMILDQNPTEHKFINRCPMSILLFEWYSFS